MTQKEDLSKTLLSFEKTIGGPEILLNQNYKLPIGFIHSWICKYLPSCTNPKQFLY